MKAKKYGKLLALACVTMLSVSALPPAAMMKKTAVRILPAPTVQILKIPILPVRIAQMLRFRQL